MTVGTKVDSDRLLRDQLLVMAAEPRANNFVNLIKDLNPQQMRRVIHETFTKKWINENWQIVDRKAIVKLIKKVTNV